MKKIINRKIYDTDTAEMVAYGDNGIEYTTDLYYRCEEMYRTRRGNYFILDCNKIIYPIYNRAYDYSCGYDAPRPVADWVTQWDVDLAAREIDYMQITRA